MEYQSIYSYYDHQRSETQKIYLRVWESKNDINFQEAAANVHDRLKFTNSEKAISMLTTASLVLKKLPKEEIKDQLKKFIKRYNR